MIDFYRAILIFTFETERNTKITLYRSENMFKYLYPILQILPKPVIYRYITFYRYLLYNYLVHRHKIIINLGINMIL